MALFLNDHSIAKIMILGLWSSDAFLVYIRLQVLEWANNMSCDMINFESFLEVGMYDITSKSDPDKCMEDMSIAVSCSDYTQIDASLTFSIKLGNTPEEGLVATALDNLNIHFNTCQGINPSNGDNQNNDLASHVYRLFLENKINEETKDEIFSTLVGYAQPGNNHNEEACKAAYESIYGCEPCDDVESPWMNNVGVDCTLTNLVDTKCNMDAKWTSKTWCKQSCFDAGNGYAGYDCCPSPTPAPTNLPPGACSNCSNIATPW
eukprot:CAMPEP_0178913612 /NCGR_PEP_ID=MMETSP0786-20121207/10944_1 /TAXON_ID=186022 /ORGANISM="Thalassionema frauenfeldii, Strain CCMP 1798" /LENGTH=262 /DNA_ID=CAMNT_0020586383 /DNA_START=1591 /DNA_END=2377 /DNA_ORIENTATION=-